MTERRFTPGRSHPHNTMIRVGIWLAAMATIAIASRWDIGPTAAVLVIIAIGFTIHRHGDRLAARNPDTVTVSDDWLRSGERTIGWAEIDQLRATHGGIDVLRAGTLVAFLSCDLERFAELVGMLERKVQLRTPATLPTRFRAPRWGFDLAGNALGVLAGAASCVWTYQHGYTNQALAGAAVLAVLTVRGLGWTLIGVDLDPSELRLRYPLRTRVIPRGELQRFGLVPRPWNLHVAAYARDRRISLGMTRVDPFVVYEAAQRAYPDLVA